MNTPAFTLESIPKELDAKGWHLEVDSSDIQVFSKKGASNVNVVGFKTVSWHPMPATKAFSILRDVCKAMELANDQYVLGETFRAWADPATEEGTLVRTSFSMPFPFAYREFLHGLHAAQPDERTYLVGYTPIEEPEIPVQKGYVRSKMHTSGQRITQLDNGMCRVEHLMVYELAGQVSKSTQDKWLKGGHVGAYLKEWRKVREVCLASSPAEIDYQGLSILAHNALETSDAWPLTKKAPQGIIKMGRFPWCPRNVVRTDLEVAAPIDKVVKILADASLEFLPQWNKEFITGEILETISTSPQKAEWLVRVQYSTPFLFGSPGIHLLFFQRMDFRK